MVVLLLSECRSAEDLHGYCTDDNPLPIIQSLLSAMSIKILLTLVTFGALSLPAGIFSLSFSVVTMAV